MGGAGFGLPIAVVAGFFFATLAPGMARHLGRSIGKVLAIVPLSLTAYFISRIPEISIEGPVRFSLPWSSLLGVMLSFRLDGLSVLFALVISFIGALILVYAGDYLHGRSDVGRFHAFLLGFMASMLGIVLSDDLITLFVFWELTSLSSFLLIGFEHDREESRKSALQALLVTSMGGLAMLAGFLLLGGASGSYEISSLVEKSDMLKKSDAYLPALMLILLGAFTKSAQFPFHFWLPNAMTAPTPVSAYLHSATMVKAGIYLIARLSPVLGGTSAWFYMVSSAGAATMLVGSVLALGQTDLKLLLAYMTVMALGALTMLLGIGSAIAIKAAMVFLIVHSLYKGALFLVVGAIDHETGTRDVSKLAALRKKMPILAAVTAITALSMAGLPPLLGFVGKELVYKAALSSENISALVFITVAVFSKAAAVMVSGGVAIKPFFGRPPVAKGPDSHGAREPPFGMLFGPFALGALGLAFGLWPELISHSLIGPAVRAVSGMEVDVELHAWPERNVATLLSAVSIAAGVIGYMNWDRILPGLQFLEIRLGEWGPARLYELGLESMQWAARWQTGFLQGGRVGNYLAIVLAAVAAGIWAFLAGDGEVPAGATQEEGRFYEWAIAGLISAASIYLLFTKTMLAALAALGVIGYSIAIIYLVYGAPDLALTQIFVETLTIVLAAMVIGRIPGFSAVREPRKSALLDGVVATGFGLAVAALLLRALNVPFDPYLSAYFSEKSVPEGFGKNIVNVILVDFRAMDTLGEITVVAVAALGIHALLKMSANSRVDP